MQFSCPYCQHTASAKNPKPGKFKPKCPKCGKVFQLVIAEDPNTPPSVAKIGGVDPAQMTAGPPPADVSEVTGAFTGLPAPPDVVETTQGFTAPPVEKPREAPIRKPPPPISEGNPDVTAPAPVPVNDRPDATGVFGNANKPAANVSGTIADTTQAGPEKSDDDEFEVNLPETPKDTTAHATPKTLGGYRLLKELGRGGMGAVFLARQVSLDRDVALKVMNPQWSKDAGFVARFTREAYAAAQLVHHNIVQIYDIGLDRDTNFFSMEFVKGQSLGDLVKKQGKVDPETAIGYILQAARGLKFAHDRGMIHRDIKPDNLMLNDQGIVKVADLGLVKTPGSIDQELKRDPKSADMTKLTDAAAANMTQVGVAMGTPAYMSPEQGRNAAGVDHRADIYSLGCTLYVLLTGEPPFRGSTIMEVLTKHATEAIRPPDTIVKRVPKELSNILQKMVAKKPEDRYADLADLIKDLENFLGEKSGSGGLQPNEEHVEGLEEAVKAYNSQPLGRFRGYVRLGVFGGLAVVGLIGLVMGWLMIGIGMIALTVEAGAVYFVKNGIRRGGPVFEKARELVYGSRWKDRLMVLAGAGLFLVVLFLFGVLHWWAVVTVLAFLIGVGLDVGYDANADSQRNQPLDRAEDVFKQLRLRGMDEDQIRQFVCKFGGDNWEEFFEELFGYEEKLKARDWWVRGQRGRTRRTFGAWREPIVTWLEGRLKARREAHERATLQAIEAKRLQSEGLDPTAARAKAERAAEVMVERAAAFRDEARTNAAIDETMAAGGDSPLPPRPRPRVPIMLDEEIEQADKSPKQVSLGRLIGGFVELIVGAPTRFFVGAALLAGCLGWMYANNLFAQFQDVTTFGRLIEILRAEKATAAVPLLPAFIGNFFVGYGAGVAGLLLMLSSFSPGWKLAIIMPVAAVVAVLGSSFGIPAVGPVSSAGVAMLIATVLTFVGIVLSRHDG
jgi:serine/threonine protein kinase